ncbi:hypothetical protein FRX31_030645 [Thalictrum thalictroides]|uniref:Uncharacterized protein n=1 Tax=Thalictrum thalictroides TaxID=46969 RepID=A0A7J6V520_THATH|nr:hypothetical protein FRX31_030645 [Thalictrum thalictroides]
MYAVFGRNLSVADLRYIFLRRVPILIRGMRKVHAKVFSHEGKCLDIMAMNKSKAFSVYLQDHHTGYGQDFKVPWLNIRSAISLLVSVNTSSLVKIFTKKPRDTNSFDPEDGGVILNITEDYPSKVYNTLDGLIEITDCTPSSEVVAVNRNHHVLFQG